MYCRYGTICCHVRLGLKQGERGDGVGAPLRAGHCRGSAGCCAERGVLGIALGRAILTSRQPAYLHLGPVGAFLAALREAYLAAVPVSLVATVACLWTKLPRQE